MYELRKLIETFGTAIPPHPSVQGRPRKIHTQAEEGILDFLYDSPTAYLDEIQDLLLTGYQIISSVPTVSRCVKKLRLTYKKISRTKPAQDDALCARYFLRIVGVLANRIVVIDESAPDQGTLDRRLRWSLKGTPCSVRQSGKRSGRWSILPAIGINGYLDYDIFQGSINTDRFTFFIRQLLRKMNPRPGPRLMLIMDNFPTHLPEDLAEMCEEAEVDLVYLPPYSPDLSPIKGYLCQA